MLTDPKVSVIVPCLTEEDWQVHLTEAVINIARVTTQVPYELVVAECGPKPRVLVRDGAHSCNHIFNPEKGHANADMNAGMDAASGNIVVLLTNDVFVKPGWLEALLECFKFSDCGLASLGTSDHREQPIPVITEGVWCPLMAMPNRPDFRFDAQTFPSYWGDSDLVMRIYQSGARAYRNRQIICDHLGRATNTPNHVRGRAEEIEAAKRRFIERHGKSHLLMFRVFMDGLII